MIYFNADGKGSSMCGNGGRCMIRYANLLGLHKYTYSFLAVDGEHEAEIDKNTIIRLKMNDVPSVERTFIYSILDTGSPLRKIRD
jgi:diaminopimelate epimerase